MRPIALLPIALLVGGVATVVAAVLRGEASVGLLIVFPFVIGSSPLLFLGVALLLAGFLTLPLLYGTVEDEAPPTPAAPSPRTDGGSSWGGLVLVGPLPVFFGKWRNAPTLAWVLAAVLGATLLVVAVLVTLLLAR